MITKMDVIEMICFCALMVGTLIIFGLDYNSVVPAYQ